MSGFILQADATDRGTLEKVLSNSPNIPLIVADPPYGEVLNEHWDKAKAHISIRSDVGFAEWMLSWTNLWSEALAEGGAFYIWGGIGVPGFRPLYHFLSRVETETPLTIANHITWKKKRAYGTATNYLFTREEVIYLTKGNPKSPRIFNIPYLEKERGYEGYDKDHPAKSPFLRRSNVWDESEIFKGKLHPTEKAKIVNEIPIRTHTNPVETVLDLFAGSGSLSLAADSLGRNWIAIEKEEKYCKIIQERLTGNTLTL